MLRLRRPFTLAWLTFMWCGLQGQFSIGNVIGGLGVALLIVIAFPLPKLPTPGALMSTVHWRKLAAVFVSWLTGLFLASAKVGWLAVRRQAPPKTAIVTVPMRVQSEFVLTLATGMYNLQPGGTVSDVDIANRMWTVHLLDAGTPERLAAELAKIRRLEADMIDIFERS